jgi:hypothetical protein
MANLSDRVIEKLSPYLGQNAARASVSMFLQKNGLTADALHRQHLPQIAKTLRPGLKVFLGAARADAVAQEIEALPEVSP